MRLDRLVLSDADAERFVAAVEAQEVLPPLSEHKLLRLGGAEDAVVAAWGDDGRLVAVSVAALHGGDEPHWALEVATQVRGRTPELERAAIGAAVSTIPSEEPYSLWVQRPEQIAAAEALGHAELRRVVRMDGPFPRPPEPSDIEIGTIGDTDDAAIIEVHNRAFAGHREASGMTRARLDEIRALPWYDPSGVVTGFIDGRLAGYCWTKLHPNGDGEVYLLAVDPGWHGRGVGAALVAAGYGFLEERGAKRAMLWVDGDNEAAIVLYRSLGLEATVANVEMVRDV